MKNMGLCLFIIVKLLRLYWSLYHLRSPNHQCCDQPTFLIDNFVIKILLIILPFTFVHSSLILFLPFSDCVLQHSLLLYVCFMNLLEKIYRRFSSRSCVIYSYLFPNNKTWEHWRLLVVLFILDDRTGPLACLSLSSIICGIRSGTLVCKLIFKIS